MNQKRPLSPFLFPLSPFLFGFKMHMLMNLSLFHRISGAVSASLLIIFVAIANLSYLGDSWYLWYIAGKSFNLLNPIIILFLSLFFWFHFWNGIRHLVWDMGFFFKVEHAYITGYIVMFLAAISVGATNFVIYFMGFL